MQENQDAETITDKVQRERKRMKKKIPQGTWMSVSSQCCVLSGRGLYF
jgi:hypothetical protein